MDINFGRHCLGRDSFCGDLEIVPLPLPSTHLDWSMNKASTLLTTLSHKKSV
jgi:hypothetical protein